MNKKTYKTEKDAQKESINNKHPKYQSRSVQIPKNSEKKFALLKENTPTIEELNEIISASIQELNENAMKTYTTSEKAPEIEKLEEERKELRVKENKTTEEKIKYTELNKTVKKKRRAKARRKRREFVLRILEGKKGPKELYKHGSKKKIPSMKDKVGRKTSNRENILKICEQFCREQSQIPQ